MSNDRLVLLLNKSWTLIYGTRSEVNSWNKFTNILFGQVLPCTMGGLVIATLITASCSIVRWRTLIISWSLMICAFIVRFALWCNVFNWKNSTIHKLFFWQQRFKNNFSILEIKPMQVFSFYFFLGCDFLAIDHAQLGNMKQTL